MTRHFLWSSETELLTKPLATALMDMRRDDGDNDLLMDAVRADEILEAADEVLTFDGVVVQYQRLERVAAQIEKVMTRAGQTVKPVAKQITPPFMQLSVLQVAVIYELSDGQTVTILFHNPDSTPKKIAATDDLVSWKWMLNKRDVTILVAPEQGQELDPREVARRIMKAAEKNSAAFGRSNAKRAERLAVIDGMKGEITGLEGEITDLEARIEEARRVVEEESAASLNLARFMALSKQADGASWGVGSPNYYGVIQDDQGDLPDDFMPETGNKQMAIAMGAMADEHGESIAVQINVNKEKPFRVIKVMFADGRGIGSDWAESAQAAYDLIRMEQPAPAPQPEPVEPDIAEPEPVEPDIAEPTVDPVEPTPEPQDDTAAIARVDAAYPFANASDDFKAWLAESVDKPDYSPFVTAKAMDERAKAAGAAIEWGAFGGTSFDSVWDETDEDEEPESLPLFDSAGWEDQPRERRTGRWRRARMRGLKRAAKKAGEAVAGAAKKAAKTAGDYVSKALSGSGKGDSGLAGKVAGKVAGAAGNAGEVGAKMDPGLAAINELVGGVKGLFDSATLDAVNDGSEYVGKLTKGGELIGRVDIGDDGKAMIYLGAEGDDRVKTPSGIVALYSDDDAADMVDWALLGGETAALAPEGAENVVKTAKGREVATGFAVVEADDLITSHDNMGHSNPDYPSELQPRDRSRESSIAWIRKTSSQLDPDSLGRTRRADTGAPIVGPDRVVESGNGRTMAIQEAYRTGKAEEYRQWLIEEAPIFKISPARVKAMRRPVLVRVRTSELDRREFAIEANQDDKLSMTGTEKARADADRLDSALMAKLADGDLLSSANRDFIRGFLASLGETEAAQYITTDGQPTGALVARVQAAVFAKAYSDDRLLELSADVGKPEVANVISALNASASEFIRAQEADKAGTDALVTKVADSVELSLNQQIIQTLVDATNLVRKAKAEGQSVDEVVAQMGLFDNIPPATAAMAVFINQNNRSAKRLGVAFTAMARHVRREAERGQTIDMFGDTEKASLESIIQAANRELEREYGEGQFAIESLDLFAVTPATPDPEPEPSPEPVEPTPEPSPEPIQPETDNEAMGNESGEAVPGLGAGQPDAGAGAIPAQADADRALVQSVIDGTVADILSIELGEQLIAIYERNEGNAELIALAEQAMDLYEAAEMAREMPV